MVYVLSVWDVRFVCCVLCVVMCCVGAGVGVQCVVRGVRGSDDEERAVSGQGRA